MKRFLLVSSLTMIWSIGLASQINAQTPPVTRNNWQGQYPLYSTNPPPDLLNGRGSQDWTFRERKWEKEYHRQFPGAAYDYYGYAKSMPGSIYNNPYSLYGPAASVPTLYYPNYVVGNWGVRVVPRRTPNIYAPTQYDYVPVPLR